MAQFVENSQEFNEVATAVESRDYDRTIVDDVEGWVLGEVIEALAKKGIKAIINDSGSITALARLSGATTTAAGTISLTKVAATGINLSKDAAVVEASSAALGGEVAGLALTPKVAILAAVAGAAGLTFGFDLGQSLVSQYFGEDFDWGTDSVGGKILTYFTKSNETYVDEDLSNRIIQRLIEIGAYEDGGLSPIPTPTTTTLNFSVFNFLALSSVVDDFTNWSYPNAKSYFVEAFNLAMNYSTPADPYGKLCVVRGGGNYSPYNGYVLQVRFYNTNSLEGVDTSHFDPIVARGVRVSTSYNPRCEYTEYRYVLNYPPTTVNSMSTSTGTDVINFLYSSPLEVSLYNIGSITEPIPSVSKQPNATYPSSGDDIEDTYPTWHNQVKNIYTPTISEPSVLVPKIPVKLKIQTTEPDTDPATDSQDDAQNNPTSTKDLNIIIGSIPELSEDVDLNPDTDPDIPGSITGEDIGVTPPLPIIGDLKTVNDTGLVGIYNPTKVELSAFSGWLWSTDFLDNLEKLFQNPMDAIIGLNIVYATPVLKSADQPIVTGFLQAKTSGGAVITADTVYQYTEVDCGQLNVSESFHNILDYSPYTKIQIYLPFIGIKDLDTNDIIGSILHLSYRIDVVTGACIAQLEINRGDLEAVIYKYAGNCAVQLPLSGANFSQVIANCIGIASSAFTGGINPVGIMTGAITGSHFSIEKSGSLGANVGAMDSRTPYLIINRPVRYEASNYELYYGYPSNENVLLGDCFGFVRGRFVKLVGLNCTSEEYDELIRLLEEGVYL